MTNRPSAERGADSPPVPVRTEHFSSTALPKTPRSRGPADSLGMRGLGSRTKPVRPAPGAASPFPRTAADQPAPRGCSIGTANAAQPYHGEKRTLSRPESRVVAAAVGRDPLAIQTKRQCFFLAGSHQSATNHFAVSRFQRRMRKTVFSRLASFSVLWASGPESPRSVENRTKQMLSRRIIVGIPT